MPTITYPVILTNKDWQKKKGVTNKGKKTGVGESLDALQKAFAISAHAKISPDDLVKETSDIEIFKKKAPSVRLMFQQSRKKLRPLFDAADKKIAAAITTFGATSSAGKHLTAMKAALKKFETNEMGVFEQQFETEVIDKFKAKVQKTNTWAVVQTFDVTRRNASTFQKCLDDVRSISDVTDKFGTLINANPPGRAVTTACKNWDQLIRAEFPEFSKKYFKYPAMDTIAKLPWIKQLGDEAGGTASKALKAQLSGGSEAQVIQKFKADAGRSWKQVEKFLDAYFKFGADLPKELNNLHL
jgi:hypothetical protein